LTRSTEFPYRGHTDVKELALYLQDTITKGKLDIQLRNSRRFLQRLKYR